MVFAKFNFYSTSLVRSLPNITEWDVMKLRDHTPSIILQDVLLQEAAIYNKRVGLCKKTKIDRPTMLDYITSADLMRIKGLGPSHVISLKGIGVKTVNQLQHLNPTRLFYAVDAFVKKNIKESNSSPRGYRISQNLVVSWLGQARNLPIIITYR